MARDEAQHQRGDEIESGEEPTAIATAPAGADAAQSGSGGAPLWSGGEPDSDVGRSTPAGSEDHGPADPAAPEPAAARKSDEPRATAGAARPTTPDGDEARRQVDAALAKVAGAKSRASDAKEKGSAKAGEARQRVGALAAGARERAASADVKELAASTTSLIDTARPFFLAFFAGLFTLLGFIEGDSGTSQLFVVGAILFVLAAGFSDELGHLGARRRRDSDD